MPGDPIELVTAQALDYLIVLDRWAEEAWALCKTTAPALGSSGVTGSGSVTP